MRTSGVLMHLTSLPSPYGIGTMGFAARAFVDFLAESGQTWWQILPIGPTSYGDSPYQSFSTFAGNAYLIDLDELAQEGLLKRDEYASTFWGEDPTQVDYGMMYEKRFHVLRKAVSRLLTSKPEDYRIFIKRNRCWLPDYALFMALKDQYGGSPWWEWEMPLRLREPAALISARQLLDEDISFWQGVQYLFFHQWNTLKSYANGHNIGVIGDLPIYVAMDSADVWSHPEQFQLGDDLRPVEVAGCPPDSFAPDGQMWGNPLFDWDVMADTGYSWWIDRIAWQKECYDILRIDHFRGFDSYYAIPFGDATARNGHWRKGPGLEFFRAIEAALGPQKFIAEDLGFLTDSVHQLLLDTGYPGMKILQFGFDCREATTDLPHCYSHHCVAYVGTHDNDTALGWLTSVAPGDRAHVIDYLKLSDTEGYNWGLMRGIWSSKADLTVVQAQDLLGLGSEARMNTPSTLGCNWKWRALPGSFTSALSSRLRHETELYGRLTSKPSFTSQKL